MERSLLAAERSVWVAAAVVGWVVVRREVVWPVSVVVAVDMGTWDLLGDVYGKDLPQRRVAARSRKKALAGDGFRGQGRAIRHRGDHRAVCCKEGQRGSKTTGRWESRTELIARRSSPGPPTCCPLLRLPTAIG